MRAGTHHREQDSSPQAGRSQGRAQKHEHELGRGRGSERGQIEGQGQGRKGESREGASFLRQGSFHGASSTPASASASASPSFAFCSVCKRNHDQGRRHNFSTSHRTQLGRLLAKAHSRCLEALVYQEQPLPDPHRQVEAGAGRERQDPGQRQVGEGRGDPKNRDRQIHRGNGFHAQNGGPLSNSKGSSNSHSKSNSNLSGNTARPSVSVLDTLPIRLPHSAGVGVQAPGVAAQAQGDPLIKGVPGVCQGMPVSEQLRGRESTADPPSRGAPILRPWWCPFCEEEAGLPLRLPKGGKGAQGTGDVEKVPCAIMNRGTRGTESARGTQGNRGPNGAEEAAFPLSLPSPQGAQGARDTQGTEDASSDQDAGSVQISLLVDGVSPRNDKGVQMACLMAHITSGRHTRKVAAFWKRCVPPTVTAPEISGGVRSQEGGSKHKGPKAQRGQRAEGSKVPHLQMESFTHPPETREEWAHRNPQAWAAALAASLQVTSPGAQLKTLPAPQTASASASVPTPASTSGPGRATAPAPAPASASAPGRSTATALALASTPASTTAAPSFMRAIGTAAALDAQPCPVPCPPPYAPQEPYPPREAYPPQQPYPAQQPFLLQGPYPQQQYNLSHEPCPLQRPYLLQEPYPPQQPWPPQDLNLPHQLVVTGTTPRLAPLPSVRHWDPSPRAPFHIAPTGLPPSPIGPAPRPPASLPEASQPGHLQDASGAPHRPLLGARAPTPSVLGPPAAFLSASGAPGSAQSAPPSLPEGPEALSGAPSQAQGPAQGVPWAVTGRGEESSSHSFKARGAGGGAPGGSHAGGVGVASASVASFSVAVPVMILGKVRGRKGRSAKRVGADWAEQRLREIRRQAALAPEAEGTPLAHPPASAPASGVAAAGGAPPGARLAAAGAPPGARLASAGGGVGESSGEKGKEWMPNFGRVWQSGPRHASLKEFEAERRELSSCQRGMSKRAHSEDGGEGRGGDGPIAGSTSGVPPPVEEFVFKPYVSKRKKRPSADPSSS